MACRGRGSLHPAAVESVYAAAEEHGPLLRNTTRPWRRPASPWTIWWRPFRWGGRGGTGFLLTGRSAALTGYCRAESGQLYLADTAAELAETADRLSYTFPMDYDSTDAQGELSSQLTEQEQERTRVP